MKKLFGSHNKTDDPGDNAVIDIQGGGDTQLPPGLQTLYSPQVAEKAHVRDIVDILGELGKLTEEQIEGMRREESDRGDCDIEHLVTKAGIGADDILMAKAELYGFKFRSIEAKDVDRKAFDKLEVSYIRNSHIIPIAIEDGTLVVATSEPANVFAIDDVKRQTGLAMKVVVCTASNIDAICDEFDDSSFDYNVDEIFNDMSEVEVVQDIEQDTEDLEKSAGESPVIKFVNYLLTNSLQSGASDIHIEPKEKYTKVRYRIDGILFDTMQAPAKMHPAVVSRLKIMANLDISERRLPQDGKIAVRMGGRGIDLRVSVLPTSHGEKVVIRILDSKSVMRGLDESGMEPKTLEEFRGQIAMPHGILLVTGPTGSGKSTTLYSALSEMESDELNVSTVEDPVEYNLEFCNQVQVIEKIGLTFAASLRSLLRQDPDIIMIGEIRDNETARISVQAALTGHLVLSTLHTNDAPSSISRLVNIGIEPYLIAASLNGILAQRLVRRICTHCKEPYKISGNMQQHVEAAGIDIKTIVHGAGCDECRGTGYAGRAGIFELMIIDDVFRDIINKDSSVNSMRLAFRESKQPSLFDDGMEKVKQGITTVEEVLRVTQVYGQNEDEAFVENLGEDRKSKSGSGKTKDKKAAKDAKNGPVMVTEELLQDGDDFDPAATDSEKE
ncbi:MAG: Flp pilus assembly complex ATPase component TadA [Planctomycetes bacterium]|nr:Flp pilus assembly complex ATPase component TadA [Planctomycetota bacterium]